MKTPTKEDKTVYLVRPIREEINCTIYEIVGIVDDDKEQPDDARRNA